jgi:hypothetical protein
MTGKTSVSLGHDTYRDALDAAGISIGGTYLDEGENCYDSARKSYWLCTECAKNEAP